jgi:hypothetical protein
VEYEAGRVLVEIDLREHDGNDGLPPNLIDAYADAAEVCFEQFHHLRVELSLYEDGIEAGRQFEIMWTEVTDAQRRGHANVLDATEMGAYSVALAVVQKTHAHYAYSRADQGSGADFYIVPFGVDDLEDAIRLEISGVLSGDAPVVNSRLNRKEAQLRAGASNLPGIACVVGFELATVRMKTVADA